MTIDDVELGRTVQLLLESRGQYLGTQISPSIYMVPSVFRELSPGSFNPKTVSIGPLHRKDQHLVEFEGQKLTYLHDLLDHVESSPPEQTLKECLEKVSCSLDRIRACYGGKYLEAYNDVDLATMMVIDGCFILDFILSFSDFNAGLRKNMLITQSIIFDLLLIENQIPFFVLEDLFECTIKPMSFLAKHIQVLLRHCNVFEASLYMRDTGTTPDHILGLLHKSYQPADDNFSRYSRFHRIPKALSAMQLDRAGVNFWRNEDPDWVLHMNVQLRNKFTCFPWFGRKPTLRMPKLYIDDFTDLVLKNLIVYEHSREVPNYVTSYVFAMDMLICTPDDVAVLAESNVLVNSLGSNEEAANMINNICKNIPIVDFFYAEPWQQLENCFIAYAQNKTTHLLEELDAYYGGYRPNTPAKLKRGTFSNPWIPFALFVVTLLFVLTLLQTIYTIKPSSP